MTYGSTSYGNAPYGSLSTVVSEPSTPQNFTAASSGNDPDLSWDSVTWNGDVGHYNVLRAPSVGGTLSEIAQVSSGTTTYDDTGAAQDEHYDYAVQAENSEGTSNTSNRDDAETLPNAPSSLSAGLFVDDVEDQDLSEYNISGAGSVYAVDTASPIDGDASIVRTDETGGYERLISDTSASDPLSNYPTKGDTFQIKFRSDTAGQDFVQSGIIFGASATNTHYFSQYQWENDTLTLNSVVNGSNSTIDSTSSVSGGSISASDTIILEVEWDDGSINGIENQITCRLYNADKTTQYGSVQATNDEHAGEEGVGIRTYVSVSGTNLTADSIELI